MDLRQLRGAPNRAGESPWLDGENHGILPVQGSPGLCPDPGPPSFFHDSSPNLLNHVFLTSHSKRRGAVSSYSVDVQGLNLRAHPV